VNETADDVGDVDDADAPPAEVIQFACVSCGGQVTAAPGEDALRCDHCGHDQPIDRKATRILEYDFLAALADAPRRCPEDMIANGRQIECKGCGARAVLAGQAGRCAFCGSAVIADLAAGEEVLLPESLLPHKVTREQSKQQFRRWINSRWFAPSDLSRRARAQGMDGVFLPYWTYDSNTTTHYTGARGDHYYVTEHYTDSNGKRRSRQVRKTRWWPASGTVHRAFDDVLICASTSLPAKLIQDLEPWDLHALRPYDAAFLAGFVAERYAVDLEAGFGHAEDRMEPDIRAKVRADIGGDEQRIYSMDIHHADVRFKHLLLPLWISSFKYGERTFRVMVNARSGEVQGERPWSWIKITLFVLAILGVIAAGVYAYQRWWNAPMGTPDDTTYEQPVIATPEPPPDATPPDAVPLPEGTFDLVAALPKARAEARRHGKTLGLTSISADQVPPSGLAVLGAVVYDYRTPRGAAKQVCDVWVEFDPLGMRWQTTDETPDAEACGKPLVAPPTCTVAEVWTRAIALGGPTRGVAELRYEARDPKPAKQDKPQPGAWIFQVDGFETKVADDCTPEAATSPGTRGASGAP
jgi:hypothetical protein